MHYDLTDFIFDAGEKTKLSWLETLFDPIRLGLP